MVAAVLVTTGATDPDGVSARLLEAVREGLPGTSVRRVRGPQCEPVKIDGIVEVDAPADLRNELRQTDLVVCLGGQTALEAACLGVPTLALAVNVNQQANVERLAAAGAVESATLDEDLAGHIRSLGRDPQRRARLSRSARRAVDGFGALRVAAEIERLLL
jgi:spore coat polysaccharide biosynthesis predicted glycosyltransferase SpsG